MKYIGAYMLSKLGGKEEPLMNDLKNILENAGIKFEEEKANELISKLNGRNLTEIIDEGKSKLNNLSNISTFSNEEITQNENEQQQTNNEHNEEEETLELGLGNVFEDLFN